MLGSDDQVPIAQYGTSNVGRNKADLSPWAERALRPLDADNLRYPLQLLVAQRTVAGDRGAFAARSTRALFATTRISA